ncbi:VOC family protein [Catenulispora pinisilvae]|uniref:VOC family protein n=1 Tax=Catenulispora pinisilvae TaxID=2705253 RepID=UPI002B26E65C|nr:VOC family protein [Catenulispora pinisilvae]
MTPPFVFMDLRTADIETSRDFYTRMFDWTVNELSAGGATVPLFGDADQPWGGFTTLTADDRRTPQWVPYAPVDNLNDALSRAIDLGATLIRPRTDLPAGSVAVIEDPGGATIALWQAAATGATT